ncbi:MAG: hypothetical protein WCI73_16075, partial [Phycisphaerae bacterium]
MQAWWRVLRGVWPYRWSVILSLVCAIGVGLSYASGVAVLLPVMKVFISSEGVHGWVNRTAAERRFDVHFRDLDTMVRRNERPTRNAEAGGGNEPPRYNLVLTDAGKTAPPDLQPQGNEDLQIVTVHGVAQSRAGQ